jgi:hypothetical protein
MLRLQPELTRALREGAGRLFDEEPDNEAALGRVKEAASRFSLLSRVATLALAVLEEQGFVQIRGFPLEPARPLFLALSELMGSTYVDPAIGTAIVPAHVQPGELLMGNQLRRLPLHTDYSMLERPPRLTMSYCIRPDAVPGFGAVSVTDIEAECYGLETAPEIELLKEVLLPFAARNAGEDVDVIDRPILARHPETNRLLVRYHRSRIVQGFRYRGAEPTKEQVLLKAGAKGEVT